MTFIRAIFALILSCSPALAAGWLLLAAPPSLQFNGGAQTRGMLTWDPLGGGVQAPACLATPSTCYPTTGLPSAQLAVLKTAGVGHLRVGIEVGPMLADTANVASVYLPAIFQSVDVFQSAGFKVVLAFSANGTFPSWTSDTIFDGGPASSNFLAYLSILQSVANYISANPSVCPPATCAFGVYNETPAAASVTGGINAQYSQLKLMFQTVRLILPKHTISLCLSTFCSNVTLVGFNGWSAADFDANSMIEIHPYLPPLSANACEPFSTYRDMCGVAAYPPTNLLSDYNSAKALYETQLAADNTWAGDCPSGSNCVAARAANKANMEGTIFYEGLACYYGQGTLVGGINCIAGQQEGLAWLEATYALVLAWLPSGVTAKQIYIGEFGTVGVTVNGAGVGSTGQANNLGDQTTAFNNAGFSWAVLGVNYNVDYGIWGLQNPSSPYAFVNPAAITALGFNGQ